MMAPWESKHVATLYFNKNSVNTTEWKWVILIDCCVCQVYKNKYIIIIITHGAEPFLSSRQLYSYSRTSQHFYGTRRLITVFTRALHWSLFTARSIQSIPSHPISLISNHIHFLSVKSFFQGIRPGPRLLVIFRNKLIFLRRGVVSRTPNPQAGGPPLIGCPRLLIQYIRSYPPYLEAVSSIRNLRTRHGVVTMNPPNMDTHSNTHTGNVGIAPPI
jgi:hypothetical protein